MLFGDGFKGARVNYADAPPPVQTYPSAQPASENLEIGRGIRPDGSSGMITVVLRIANIDTQNYCAVKIIVSDQMPAGYEYVWDTAVVNSGCKIEKVVGTNPYHFYIARVLPAKGQDGPILLEYQALPLNMNSMKPGTVQL
jgi:hypothetical protein